MFVVMALVTTVATSPLTKWLYPHWYIKKLDQWKRGEIDWDGKPIQSEDATQSRSLTEVQDAKIHRLLVYLRLDSLPSVFTFVSLLGDEKVTPKSEETSSSGPSENTSKVPVLRKRSLEVHALRIVELTERTSSVMKVAEADDYSLRDPVVNAFRTFSRLHDVAVSGKVVIAPEDSYAQTVVTQALLQESDFVLIPWSEAGSNKDDQSIPSKFSSEDRFTGKSHLDFIQTTLSKAACNTGIFIGNGFGGVAPKGRPGISRTVSTVSMRSQKDTTLLPLADKSHKIFFPYVGGIDDQVALRFILQLAKNPLITVTIAYLDCSEADDEIATTTEGNLDPTASASYSKAAINTGVTAQDISILATLQSNLSPDLAGRITFTEHSVAPSAAVKQATDLARETVGKNSNNAGDIVVVGRRHPRFPATPRTADQKSTEYDMQKTVGVLGQAMAMNDLKASVLVIQAGGSGFEQ